MGFFSSNTQKNNQRVFAALDLGSSKICCAIAKPSEQEGLEILGVGHQASRGLKNGKIVQIDALEDAILNSVHGAEQMAEQTISSVFVNFPSLYTDSKTAQVEIDLDQRPVDEGHMRRLLTFDYRSYIPPTNEILHVFPITYVLDNSPGIRNPLGLTGKKLRVALHLLSAPTAVIDSLKSCLARCHLDLASFVITSYASALSTLVEDEMNLGTTIVDFGAGVTTMASFLEGALVHFDSIALGGERITKDIARGLSTPIAHAERLKTLYGSLLDVSSDDQETISVPQMGEAGIPHQSQVPKSFLTHIVKSRMEEMLEITRDKLKFSGMDRLACQRVVLTGGSSQFHGLQALASKVFGRSVRIAKPYKCKGLSDFVYDPMFATCSGLLEYAWRDFTGREETVKLLHEPQHMWNKVSHWIKENF